MKLGVLTFSYRHSAAMAEKLRTQGYISINLGDFMQTLASRTALRRIGAPDEDVVAVDRDSLADYDGPEVALLMNGCFYDRCFPIPERVRPVFIGFQAKAGVIAGQLEYLKRHEPIGCRDLVTAKILNDHGIAAFVTGCLTMLFGRRPPDIEPTKVLAVYGAGAGAFPGSVLGRMPPELLPKLEFISQRKVCHNHPLTERDLAEAETFAAHLLEYYRRHAALVITPLHHAATPCLASGIPLVICRRKPGDRFSYLEQIIPVHTPPTYSRIDWRPEPPDIGHIQAALIQETQAALRRAGAMPTFPRVDAPRRDA